MFGCGAGEEASKEEWAGVLYNGGSEEEAIFKVGEEREGKDGGGEAGDLIRVGG